MKKLHLNNDLVARLDQLKQRLAQILPMEDMDQIHGGACGGCSHTCNIMCGNDCGGTCFVNCDSNCSGIFIFPPQV